MPLANTTPSLQMISARPIFLDLAFNHLKYPTLKSQQGLMGKVFSKFSIWGK